MMITGAIWWAAALSGACLAVWAVFIVFIPNCLCSLFRYRLWRLRDAVKDDVLHGRLLDGEVIGEFLSMIERFILVADKITLAQMLLLPSNRQEEERQRKAMAQAISELGEEPRRAFMAYLTDFRAILMTRLLIGSLTGWTFLAFLLPVILTVLVCRMVQRASPSVMDVIISAIKYIDRAWSVWRRKEPNLDLPCVAGRIMAMPVVSSQLRSLSDCAA